jgi:hypothetical protein
MFSFSLINSPPAIERLSSGLFQEVIVTNTIPVLDKKNFPQLTVLSVANLLGETIWRVHDDCSVCYFHFSFLSPTLSIFPLEKFTSNSIISCLIAALTTSCVEICTSIYILLKWLRPYNSQQLNSEFLFS